jgi:hypothetical protein
MMSAHTTWVRLARRDVIWQHVSPRFVRLDWLAVADNLIDDSPQRSLPPSARLVMRIGQ